MRSTMDRKTLSFPYQLEGLSFLLEDLRFALTWAESRPDVRVRIRLDCFCINEVLEIYPPECSVPRWCIWQTLKGGLQVDDLYLDQFALPYPTVKMALRYIASNV